MNRWTHAIDVIEDNLLKNLNLKGESEEGVNIYALMTKFSPIFTLIICYYATNN